MKKSNGRNCFRLNISIVNSTINSTITYTQHEDTADLNTVKLNIETYHESNENTPSNISKNSSPEFTIGISLQIELMKHPHSLIFILLLLPVSQMTILD